MGRVQEKEEERKKGNVGWARKKERKCRKESFLSFFFNPNII